MIDFVFGDEDLVRLPAYVKYIVFLYVVANEVLVTHETGQIEKLEAAISKIITAKEMYRESNKSIGDLIDIYFKQYDSFWRFRILEERVFQKNEEKVEEKISDCLKEKYDVLDRLDRRISENKDILEGIEDNTGFTALFSGLNKYATMLKKELRRASNEVRNIKYLLFLTPAVSMLLSLIVEVEYGFYISVVSIMVVLGLFLKVGLRKEDQYEQLLSKVENRVAIAVFHKYRLKEMEESEGRIANEKFHSFIYSELETSDWNAPDVGEGLLKILKELKGK
ncbi:hypothetical protein EI420_03170 [Vreelandella venusta]|uniref:Uncharacterized protein n=1 Tax=Vreelandella venusta TaxID=44935 RepID=A0ABX2B5T9_9GAMM|nr:hypothetical protein [Halomonas venusta]AZM94745.1 hypothetical protein EI420_03170 [Halomonas venusta]NPT29237.1 hypothetical protein [Halomonas venusta]